MKPVTYQNMRDEMGLIAGPVPVYVRIDGALRAVVKANIRDHPLSGGMHPHFVLELEPPPKVPSN